MKIVVKSTGSWYDVLDTVGGDIVKCRLRGALRLGGSRATNPVVVGDRVRLEEDAIVGIEPRTNYIIRRASNLSKQSHILAANIDKVYVVTTLDNPPTSPEFIDRVLVTAECYGIQATIIVNKCDLIAQDYITPIYTKAGYPVMHLSALKGQGIEPLREQIKGQTVLFMGNSGVGKSTLINAIDPTLSVRTGEMSAYHNRGKHTTTFSEIFPFGGGYLIDTPGVKGFGLVDVPPEQICHYFPEMMQFAPDCGFYNCTHTHEPKCAVIEAVMQNKIDENRYQSYLKILEQDNVKYR